MAELEGRSLGRYELQQLIGRGGMADVYLAYDPHFERDVAVKVFKREDEDLLRRFIREARLMASLSNVHLMPVYDTGTSLLDGRNIYYIVMPYLEGGTLRGLVRQNPLPLDEVCQYLSDIADALDYMHQRGIIHRDIKSSNILLDAEGRCYLSDFGIARTSTDATQMTSTGNVLGTVDYIAPELFESNYRADERSDYYSLGVLLYEMVTGHLPFVGENQIAVVTMHVSKRPPSPRTFVPTLSPQVEGVMMKALEKRPEMRYDSAKDLAEAFCRAVSSPRTAVLYDYEDETERAQNGVVSPTPVFQSAPSAATHSGPMVAQRSGYYPVASAQQQVDYPQQTTTQRPFQQEAYEQPGRGKTSFLTFMVILVLLAVVGSMTYILVTNSQHQTSVPPPVSATPDAQATSKAASATAAAQSHATATVLSQASATAVAQAHATATIQAQVSATAAAQAHATATVQAQASATAGVIQTATASTPLYSDPLNNANNPATQAAQWDQNGNCSFQDDGYHVSTGLLATFKGCQESGQQYQNFAIQTDMSIQRGTSGGLFFRLNAGTFGTYKGYLFEVNTNGQYRVLLSDNFSSNNMTTLHDWTSSSALKNGSQINQLEVIAQNNTFLLYINGVYQPDPIQDSTYTAGTVGFLATDTNQGEQASVVYSNLNIYKLS